MDDLYIIKFSYHLYEQVYAVIFQSGRRDFAEIFLHHMLTILLIFFSYSVNYTGFGASIMLIHDITDTIVSLFKLSADITRTWFQAFTYFLMFSGWIYFRLYILPMHLMTSLYQEGSQSDNPA